MYIRPALVPLSAVAALALLLSGCAGSDGDAGGTAEGAERVSPLSEYLDAVYGGELSPEEQERQFAEEQARIEELVAQCMQDQGFEYTPNTASGTFVSGGESEWEPDDRDWVAQYGYGAVTSPFTEEPVPEEEFVDPNADYVASLSESEQTAFYEALHGPVPDEDELAEDGSYEYDWTTAGCQGAAQHEVAGEDPSQSEEFEPLFEAIDELYTSTASWPGMAELDGEWAACMDAAGHGGHATQMDAQNSVYEEMNEIYESVGTSEDGVPTGEPDQAALDALAEREVELALADLDCREEVDYRDRSAEITREVEQQFIDDHQAELDALVAAAERD
ncbi:hypothetical protein SAMN05660464_3892 [Geodermatophilus dictyosporus]|uniref:DUF305 domain-containing protein n=1 Tax=Geodermatophilus dictyosporus TaxID=1523247 RepID=A0A1I5SAR7_9ACTN|nr:hypothetical protein [Geodermatophilus dictyosporus]SFP67815.1 hypothetical protein SAMN05660464_3892 [Geodermatophilus dictyosporus]